MGSSGRSSSPPRSASWLRRGAPRAAVCVTAIVGLLLGASAGVSARGEKAADPKKEALRTRKLPLDDPVDFPSLRKKADALAAGQDSAFRPHQIEVELESSRLRIKQVDFRYFRPERGDWEELVVHISTAGRITMGGTPGHAYPGSIGAGRTLLSAPSPTAAPTKLINPDDAIRALSRARLTGAFGVPGRGSAPSYLRDPSQWTVRVQLVHTAAQHKAGNVALSPLKDHVPWAERYIQPALNDPFFKQTAPRNSWVWWTVLQDPDAAEQRLEYVYMEPSTGRATSHCAQPSSPSSHAPVAVACARSGR